MRHPIHRLIVASALFAAVIICTPAVAQNDAEVMIVPKYAMNSQKLVYNCLDSSQCRKEDTDRDESSQLARTEDAPYDGKALWRGSGEEHYTTAFANRNGISRADGMTYFDERKNTGMGTHTSYGPNGESVTEAIKAPPILNIDKGFWTNSIGKDTSANWTQVTCDSRGKNMISNSGVMEGVTYSTDSKQLLVIKGQSNRLYKVTVSAEARTWSLLNKKIAKDILGGCPDSFNPAFHVTLGDVSCASIKIGNQQLNNNCQTTITLAGNSSLEVTPKVNVPRYGYTVSALSVKDVGPAPSPSASSTRQ